MAEDKPRNPNF